MLPQKPVGQSTECMLLWEISRAIERLTQVIGSGGTTTTTTTLP